MGQMFLKYATSDIGKLLGEVVHKAAHQIAASGALVDGGKSVH
ncbi:hypothetical protein ABMA32_13930 [Mesorhizobium sp. VNQ89]